MARPEWFIRALLYWDCVAIIAPPSYAAGHLPELTREYVERELLQIALPEDGWDLLVRCWDAFLRNLADDELAARQRAYLAGHVVTKVHLEKLECENYGIVSELGLALPRDACLRRRNGLWGFVETTTAGEYTGALAAAVSHPLSDFASKYPGVQWVPATDEPHGTLHLLGGRSRFAREDERHMARARSFQRRSDFLTVILERLLPVPSAQAVSADRLMTFRRRYGDEMRSFRLQVEERVRQILLESDADQMWRLGQICDEFEQEIRNAEKRLLSGGLQALTRAPLIQLISRPDPTLITKEGVALLAGATWEGRRTPTPVAYVRRARKKVLRYRSKTAAIPIMDVPQSPLIESFGYNRPDRRP